MKTSKFLLYMGTVVAICVSVAWALVRVEAGVRGDLIGNVEKRIERMHDDLKGDIRELREVLLERR